jgi:DNA-binding NarL/FixJ family response regulator
MSRVRVLIADDHALVAEGMAALLASEFELVGRASEGNQLVDAATRAQPDVVVTDIRMPELNGIEALRELKRRFPRLRAVVVTMLADPYVAAEALQAGADGYVLKHSAGVELVQAVREVSAGRRYITPLIERELAPLLERQAEGYNDHHLTPRQRQVLQLVAEGHSMKHVGTLLGVSRRTAESHKYQIMEALGVHSTAELVQHALRMGLVTMYEAPARLA